MDDLRRQAGDLIRSRLGKISVAQAAIDLNVSRQAIYDIKKDKYCPSMSLIEWACQAWELNFNFRGIEITGSTFRKKGKKTESGAQLKLNLVEAIRQIDQSNFEVVKAKPMGRAVEVTIRLTIPA